MPKAKHSAKQIRRIAIDGYFLDEVRTRLHAVEGNWTSYSAFPVEAYAATEDADGVTLKLPAITALQLFMDGVLAPGAMKPVRLTLAGRALEKQYLQWMHALPEDQFGNPILLRFGPRPPKSEAKTDPRAWLKSLVPLKLYPQGEWDPAEEYWGEPDEPIETWAKPIIKRGVRPSYEMRQVLPGLDPDDIDSDPILEANELKDSGKIGRAKKLLEGLLIKDMRCLDAHAHLGNIAFDDDARSALEHYQRGVLIGELSLGDKFEGVLSWRMINSRPFLPCLSGFGICLWRLNRFEEAEAVFERLLWMSPSDNLGVRFLLGPVRARKLWTPDDPLDASDSDCVEAR